VQAVTAAEPRGDQPGSGCGKYDIEQTYTTDKEASASARIDMRDQIPEGPELQAILRHHVQLKLIVHQLVECDRIDRGNPDFTERPVEIGFMIQVKILPDEGPKAGFRGRHGAVPSMS